MNKIYIIEITDSNDHFDVSTKTYKDCFTSYDSAKEFILNYFECKSDNQGNEYFTLKDNESYPSDFSYGDVATIQVLNLKASKVNVFDTMIDNLKDEEFMKKVMSKMHEEWEVV